MKKCIYIQLVASSYNDFLCDNKIDYNSHNYNKYNMSSRVFDRYMFMFDCKGIFGKTIRNTFSYESDAIQKEYINFILPDVKMCEGYYFQWINNIGEYLFENIHIDFNSLRINTQDGEFYSIYNELMMDPKKYKEHLKLIGQQSKKKSGLQTPKNYHSSKKLSVELQMWYNKYSPLRIICYRLMEIKLIIQIRELKDICRITDINGKEVEFNTKYFEKIPTSLDDIYILRENIYYINRDIIHENSHFDLITQLQKKECIVMSEEYEMPLHFNGNCRDIIWIIKPYKNKFVKKIINGLQIVLHDNIMNDILYFLNADISEKEFNRNQFFGSQLNNCSRILKEGEIMFDKVHIIKESGKFFNKIIPKTYYPSIPKNKNIYAYSFSQHPEYYQPTGHCNFSKLRNLKIRMKLKGVNKYSPVKIIVYAINYNILITSNGMGSLKYSW